MSPQKPAQAKQGTSPSNNDARRSQKLSASSRGKSTLHVKSLLIEPRENEPPRVSVSVEYSEKAPTMKELKKAALAICHDVVRREGKLEDLGFRTDQTNRSLVQTFECREKESK